MTASISSVRAPSTTLLRTFLKPSPCSSCQVRAAHSFMPRSKYAKITSLDKLHRKQKKDLRQERLNSEIRAKVMQPPSYAPVSAASISATPPPAVAVSTAPSTASPEQSGPGRGRNKPAEENDKEVTFDKFGVAQLSTDTSAVSAPPSMAAAPEQPAAPARLRTAPPPLPYLIKRTPSMELPVYQATKSGGSKHITTVRKLSGNLEAMQAHLLEALGLEAKFIDRQGRRKDNVVINHRTQQIVVRGWRGPEIKQWAQMVGF